MDYVRTVAPKSNVLNVAEAGLVVSGACASSVGGPSRGLGSGMRSRRGKIEVGFAGLVKVCRSDLCLVVVGAAVS